MKSALFKELAVDYAKYNLDEIKDIKLMTLEEINQLQEYLEYNMNVYDNWNILRLCFTCKNLLKGN